MKIKINRCPYNKSIKLYKYSELELNKGITILIGRNGSGKSTLLFEISKYCKENGIPCFKYDNYKEGGRTAHENYSFFKDFSSLQATLFHSEGEQIFYNFGQTVEKIGKYVRSIADDKPVIILLDALDSGLDCDGIDQILNLCKVMQESRVGDIYLVLTANNYGIIHKQRCIDVTTGKEIRFDNFEDYHNFISKQYKALRTSNSKPKSKPRRLK